jgi:hypothetical protein
MDTINSSPKTKKSKIKLVKSAKEIKQHKSGKSDKSNKFDTSIPTKIKEGSTISVSSFGKIKVI